MFDDLNMEMPYDLVREGKWTIDVFKQLLRQGTNLNGDKDFEYSSSGSSIYGCTSFYRLCTSMITGAEVKYLSNDSNGIPYLTLESDRFYTLAEKLADFFKNEGDYIEANARNEGKHYHDIFMSGRALFLGGGVMSAGLFREMEDSFGILPLPKFDEEQDRYYAWMNYDINTMCIPVTNSDTSRTGIILDALSYLSYRDILPKYYNIRVSQKSLRNDDSIEMLDIIRESLYYDAGLTYGWTLNLMDALRKEIVGGSSNVASIIAKYKDSVAVNIEKTYSLFK